ncbi:hypothetical protein BH24CHL4_BH24CHL4_16780 [soil metagenome]
MNREFIPVALSGIKPGVEQHLASLPGVIDSFLEEHFLASNHYLIQQNGETAGFASIHGQTLITQFSLDEPFRKFGQERFRQLRAMEKVQSAFVPTFDDFFSLTRSTTIASSKSRRTSSDRRRGRCAQLLGGIGPRSWPVPPTPGSSGVTPAIFSMILNGASNPKRFFHLATG